MLHAKNKPVKTHIQTRNRQKQSGKIERIKTGIDGDRNRHSHPGVCIEEILSCYYTVLRLSGLRCTKAEQQQQPTPRVRQNAFHEIKISSVKPINRAKLP